MKSNPTLRDICGTEAGYRKHRRENEKWCVPCNEAHNVHRRATYNPDKNRQYMKKYLAVPGNAERARENLREWHRKQMSAPEVVAARKAREEARAEARRVRDLERWVQNRNVIAAAVTRDRKADLRIARLYAREDRYEATAVRRSAKKLLAQMASEATYVAKEAERQGRSMARVAELAARKAEREAKRQEWLNRPIEHGTTLTEYRRCLKRPEGSCDECKAIAAACAVGYRARNVERIRERERLWAQANPEKVRDMNRRQKTRRERKGRENGYEPYTRQKILERDNYLCWICGEPVDLSAPHQVGEPGWEMYPHLDHVIPLSKGGPDTPANVRTAHARCNMDKGAKVVGVAAD